MKAFIILLFSFSVFASNELNTFCFQSSSELKQVRKDINFLIIDSDKINMKASCMEIYTNQRRSTLFVKYIKSNFPAVQLTPTVVSQRSCKFKISEVEKSQAQDTELNLANKNIQIQKTDSSGRNTKTSSLQVLEGMDSEIKYGEHRIKFKCLIRGKTYVVEFSSNSPTLSFQTSRTLIKGQKIEIGSLLENIDDDSSTKSLGGIKLNKTQKNSKTLMFLELN
jgi:hypothetical protein